MRGDWTEKDLRRRSLQNNIEKTDEKSVFEKINFERTTSLEDLTEAGTRIYCTGKSGSIRGPGKKGGVFYNPAMSLNRDITLLAFLVFLEEKPAQTSFLDGMCATGVRGIRIIHTLREKPLDTLKMGQRVTVHFNDVDPLATGLATLNVEKNVAEHSTGGDSDGGILEITWEITTRRVQSLLWEKKFDFVDIDPFGTAVSYIESALEGTTHGGIAAFTTTDVAVLAGTYPQTCMRRYHARPLKNHFAHETGLRIFLGHIVLKGAERDIGISPLLAYYHDHYFRVYLRVEKSRSKARKAVENLGLGVETHLLARAIRTGADFLDILYRAEGANAEEEKRVFGPLYTGPLAASPFIKKMLSKAEKHSSHLARPGQTKKLLTLIAEETDMPPFFYDTNVLASILKIPPPPLQAILSTLTKKGYSATKTHFSPKGFKTDAPENVVEEICLRNFNHVPD